MEHTGCYSNNSFLFLSQACAAHADHMYMCIWMESPSQKSLTSEKGSRESTSSSSASPPRVIIWYISFSLRLMTLKPAMNSSSRLLRSPSYSSRTYRKCIECLSIDHVLSRTASVHSCLPAFPEALTTLYDVALLVIWAVALSAGKSSY